MFIVLGWGTRQKNLAHEINNEVVQEESEHSGTEWGQGLEVDVNLLSTEIPNKEQV